MMQELNIAMRFYECIVSNHKHLWASIVDKNGGVAY